MSATHICERCGKIFKYKRLLTSHMNRKYPCKKIETVKENPESREEDLENIRITGEPSIAGDRVENDTYTKSTDVVHTELENVESKFQEVVSNTNGSLRFIDLFCGIGGFHQALSKMGHVCVFASDIDLKCRESYEKNYGISPVGDITKVSVEDIPDFDILCAGFPCQPFSKAGLQEGFADQTRGTLFYNILRIIHHHRPRWLILENVRNLATHGGGNTWKTIRSSIREAGYNTYEDPIIANVLHFQIPQFRERVLILAARNDMPFPERPILPKNPKSLLTTTLSSVISPDCHEHRPQMTSKYLATRRVWNQFLRILHENHISIPKFPLWTDWWDKRIDELSEERLASPNTNEVVFYKKYKDWIDNNQSFYHEHYQLLSIWLHRSREDEPLWVGAVRKLEWQAGSLSYETGSPEKDSLDAMLWALRGSGVRVKKPDYTPTLVAMAMIPVYGPLNVRLSPRELLRLQSFSDTFVYNPRAIFKQIGNAVNVKMINWAATYLLS